jgi:hypothetical protein
MTDKRLATADKTQRQPRPSREIGEIREKERKGAGETGLGAMQSRLVNRASLAVMRI